jgi:hypothetical protein
VEPLKTTRKSVGLFQYSLCTLRHLQEHYNENVLKELSHEMDLAFVDMLGQF